MNDTNSKFDYDSLSPKDKAAYNVGKVMHPDYNEEQLWRLFLVQKQIEETNQYLRNKRSDVPTDDYEKGGRTKSKDAIMKTIIYGGGFVAESVASVALSVLCSLIGNPHAHNYTMGSKNVREERKDKAWKVYCKEGHMLEGLKVLLESE